MPPSHQLPERRRRAALTQAQVARSLEVPRELISMWETGARSPNPEQIDALARLYGVKRDDLLTGPSNQGNAERLALYRHLPQDATSRREVERWLDFLDDWAEMRTRLGDTLSGPRKPPRKLVESEVMTDGRRAPTLAIRVREHFQLGLDALPDFYAFLDEQQILTYRASLGSIGEGSERISGAFYNHPRLGYCILVNDETTPGRQTFTMAHEYAHALYHYALGGLISRKGDWDAKESFANAFAAHFLVPGKALRRRIEDDPDLDAYQALRLAAYFRVSYATLLNRLLDERLISATIHREWKSYSPRAMARAIRVESNDFQIPTSQEPVLSRYPASVLKRLKRAIDAKQMTLAEAAGVLRVEVQLLSKQIAPPQTASAEEVEEFDELPF